MKQVLVLRSKYINEEGQTQRVRKGKLIAQGAHASVSIFISLMKLVNQKKGKTTLSLEVDNDMYQWMLEGQKKIATYVESEEDLLKIYSLAKEKGLPTSLIRDSGKTEFHGVPTYTAVAVGPAQDDKVDEITGHLPLL